MQNQPSMAGKALGLLRRLWIEPVLVVLTALVLAATWSGFWYLSKLQAQTSADIAELGARLQAETLSELRSLYTAEVVEKLRSQGVEVSHDFKDSATAIPLPASLTIALGEQIAAHGSPMQVRLYSDFPFPWRKDGGPRDSFERDALQALRSEPARHYVRLEERAGRQYIRYAVADRMHAQCLSCHNGDPNSPKRDWKVGDVRGVLAVSRPIGSASAQAELGMRKVFGAIGLLALLGLGGGAMFIGRQRRLNAQLGAANATLSEHQQTLELRVQERTQELLTANLDLSLLNSRLSVAHMQLLESEKLASLGQLAAGIAHEINTPIAYILSNFGTLENYLNSLLATLAAYEEADQLLASMDAAKRLATEQAGPEMDFLKEEIPLLMAESREGIIRVKEIVQNLKDFSRVGQERDWVFADVNEGLSATLKILRRDIESTATLSTQFGALPPIECKLGELNQVFLNVILNALQAMEGRQGQLSVTSVVGADCVHIEIGDNGCGIREENLAHVFEPFYTSKPIGKNAGLGLSVAYGIIQKHGGNIELKSIFGMGTKVRMTLPLRQVQTPGSRADA